MAEGKKGFILYADQKELFEQLSDMKAGILIKHIFKYVNDENPISKDMIINLAFTPIKQQLKRDLKKFESRAQRSRENGKAGGRPKNPEEPKEPSGFSRLPKEPKKPDTVNDTVTVNVNDTVTDNVNETVIEKKEGVIFHFNTIKFIEQWLFWKDFKKDEFKLTLRSRNCSIECPCPSTICLNWDKPVLPESVSNI